MKASLIPIVDVPLAMIQAAKALSTKPSVAGQAYFITNDDAQPFWRFLGDFLEPLGYGRPRIKLPFYPILMLAMIFEYLVRYHQRFLCTEQFWNKTYFSSKEEQIPAMFQSL